MLRGQLLPASGRRRNRRARRHVAALSDTLVDLVSDAVGAVIVAFLRTQVFPDVVNVLVEYIDRARGIERIRFLAYILNEITERSV